jgi:hypothetical protein
VAVGSALLTAAPHGPFPASLALAGMSPAEVDAIYKITLNGFEIGSFRFSSKVTPDHYTADSDVELSALLGAFHWRGVTRTSGTIAGKDPKPAGFLFEFDGTAKSGSVQLGFNQSGVQSVSVLPISADPPDTVPLSEQHLKGVLDPLTAIMALTHVDGGSPCGGKVAIFDGKQRFDLELSYRRQAPIGESRTDMAIVCRVKYVPIAGYRANEETRNMANTTGIEIAFRPVPKANLMLPQDVIVPTLVGPAELTLVRVEIRTPDLGQIALVE